MNDESPRPPRASNAGAVSNGARQQAGPEGDAATADGHAVQALAAPPRVAPPAAATWLQGLDGWRGFLLICAAWILVRPYQGVRHDAVLYLGQALHRLLPDVLDRDIFFSQGSQDRYTLVSRPLAWLMSHAGIGSVEMALTALANLAFVAAVWSLCGLLAPGRRWICALSVTLVSHAYARLAEFNYAENFFSGRSLAEPLALLALVAWAQRRHFRAGALFGVAALIHPLMAIPALVAAWCMRVAEDRRWLWAAAAAALPILLLAGRGVAPFAGLFQRFDDTWWEIIGQVGTQVRMRSWELVDLEALVLDLMLLGLACTVSLPIGRRVAQGVLAASLLLLPIAFIGGDVVRDVLVVQLQLWRVLWLDHVLAMAFLPLIALEYWREGGAGRLVGAAAVTAVLVVSWTLQFAWIFVLWLVAALVIRRRPRDVSDAVVRLATWATLLGLALTSVVLAVSTYRFVAGDPMLRPVVHPALALLNIPTLGLLATCAVAWLMRRCAAWSALPLLLVLALGASQWDQRSQWNRTVVAPTWEHHPFEQFIARSAQVYWHLQLLPTWALLHRASFISENQGAGIVFNRGTALNFAARAKPMRGLMEQQAACQMAVEAAGGTAECQPQQSLVEAFCSLPVAPDFMVFDARYSRGLVATWDYQVVQGGALRTAYLYDCAKMR